MVADLKVLGRSTHNYNASERGGECPGCHLEDALKAIRLLRGGFNNIGDARVLRRPRIDRRKVLHVASQRKGVVATGPCSAVSADGAKTDFITCAVIA